MDKFIVDYLGTRFELYGAAAKAMQILVDENAELRAENERLRVDAERYRWLKDRATLDQVRAVMDLHGSKWDAAIDAARADAAE